MMHRQARFLAFVVLSKQYCVQAHINVFALDSYSGFAIVQVDGPRGLGRLLWRQRLKDDPVYTPSDCFETFPFPTNWGLQGSRRSGYALL